MLTPCDMQRAWRWTNVRPEPGRDENREWEADGWRWMRLLSSKRARAAAPCAKSRRKTAGSETREEATGTNCRHGREERRLRRGDGAKVPVKRGERRHGIARRTGDPRSTSVVMQETGILATDEDMFGTISRERMRAVPATSLGRLWDGGFMDDLNYINAYQNVKSARLPRHPARCPARRRL